MNSSTLPLPRLPLPGCHGNVTLLPPSLESPSHRLYLVSLILGSSALLLSVVCLLFNIALRNNRVMKMSSPRLNIVIATGAILASLYLMLKGIDYYLVVDNLNSKIVCQVRQCLLVISFTLTSGPMVGKTWRVNQIFHLAGSKRVVIKDVKILLFTCCLLLVDIGLLVGWAVLDPVAFRYVVYLDQITINPSAADLDLLPEYLVTPTCTSHRFWLWNFTLMAVKCPLLLFGMRESWWTRGMVLPHFNDSTALIISILTTVAMATTHVAASVAFREYPDVTNTVSVVCVWAAIVTCMVLVFIPKLLLWKRASHNHVTHRVSISSACSSAAVLQSFEQMEAGLVSANAEIETLKEFIRQKEMNIQKLQTLLNDAEDNLAQIRLEPVPSAPVVLSENSENIDQKKDILNTNNNFYCSSSSSSGSSNTSNNANSNNDLNASSRCTGHVAMISADSRPCRCRCCRGNGYHADVDLDHDGADNTQCHHHHDELQQQHQPHPHPWSHYPCMVPTPAPKARRLSYDNLSSYRNSRRCSCQTAGNDDVTGLDFVVNQLGCFNSSTGAQMVDRQRTHFLEKQELEINVNETNNNSNMALCYENKLKEIKRRIAFSPTANAFGYSSDGERRDTSDPGIDTPQRLFDTDRYSHPKYDGRRRSSTPSVSSIASLDTLNRLRSDLNDALAISASLRSGWATELARATRRATRTRKSYDRKKRRSVTGIQRITDSIMASYDYRQNFDNQSYISDCLTSASSECSSDPRSDRRKMGVSNNLKKLWQKRRQSADQGTFVSFKNTLRKTNSSDSISRRCEDEDGVSKDAVGLYNAQTKKSSHGFQECRTKRGNPVYNVADMGLDVSQSRHRVDVQNIPAQAPSTIKNDSLYPPSSGTNRHDEMINSKTEKLTETGSKSPTYKTGILSNKNNLNRGESKSYYNRYFKGTVTFADLDSEERSGSGNESRWSSSPTGLPRSQSDNALLQKPTSYGAENSVLRVRLASADTAISRGVNDPYKGQGRFHASVSAKDLGSYGKSQALPDQNVGPCRQIKRDVAEHDAKAVTSKEGEARCGSRLDNSVVSETLTDGQVYLSDQNTSSDSFA